MNVQSNDQIASSLEQRLLKAVKQGRFSWARNRIKDGANVNFLHVEGRSVFTATALTEAVVARRADLVRLLLDNGADPNLVAHIDSPLNLAVQCGSASICSLLLTAGADPEFVSSHGKSPHDLCDCSTRAGREIEALLNSRVVRSHLRTIVAQARARATNVGS